MGGVLSQSPRERAALDAAWRAHPLVRAYRAACVAHARAEGLSYDAPGMSEMMRFSCGWLAVNGPLPDSGIQVG